MLTLQDLDIENQIPTRDDVLDALETRQRRHADHELSELRETRSMLGKFTVRDMTEAIYGTEITKIMLGEHGGEDVLVEELSASEDIVEAHGGKRRDVGGNRMPTGMKLSDMTPSDRATMKAALERQMGVVEGAVADSQSEYFKDDGKKFTRQVIDNSQLCEDQESIKQQLLSQTKR